MKGVITAAAVVFIGLVAPAAASADAAPAFTETPVVAGVPRASELLTATAAWTGDPEPTVAWKWLRCEETQPSKCKAIAGAVSATYRVVAADVGSRLRVAVELENGSGQASARSEPTGRVERAPDPEPQPQPEPEPEPGPQPAPDPETEPATGGSPPSTPPRVVFDPPARPIIGPPVTGAAQPPLLRPFPIVRIRGWLTRTGARVALLSVRAPRGTRITARCRGRSCPVRRIVRIAASLTRLRPLQGDLVAGTRLDIRVTKAGYVGKWTTIVIRRGRAPRRADRCLYPGARRPAPCPPG
jgi:hypothetical protein